MSKKILLIESDADFARGLSDALERKGFETRTTGDGKEGLDLAREELPDAIVLCVELPKMSGYSICAKLKKDEALKAIPVVIISAEATPETFDQHRQLKTRAEDYLIKPFESAQLVERLGTLIGLPVPEAAEAQPSEEPAQQPAASEEEVVTLADVELESLAEATVEPEPEPLGHTTPQFGALATPSPESEDEDLKLLDNAFESIASPTPDNGASGPTTLGANFPFGGEERPSAPAPIEEAELLTPATPPSDAVAEEEAALLEAFGPSESTSSVSPPEEEAKPIRGAKVEALRAAGIAVLGAEPEPTTLENAAAPIEPHFGEPLSSYGQDSDLARALEAKDEDLALSRREIAERDSELQHLREHVQDLEARVVRGAGDLAKAETDLRARDADLASIRSRLESSTATVKKLEADLRTNREELQRIGERTTKAEKELALVRSRAEQAEKDLGLTRERAEEAERAVGQKAAEMSEVLGKLEAAEQELDGLRLEIAAAQNEASSAREDFDRQAEGLQKRLQELETSNSKNEERVVKAYQKIKGDEKLREKTRKALTIALQLLDEHGGQASDPDKRSSARE